MTTKKPFQLSRGCSIALVCSLVLSLLIAACVLWWFRIPNDLGIGLGRGGRIANILVSTEPGHRERLVIYEDGTAVLSFPDQPGIYSLAPDITLRAEEWQAFNTVYKEWCANPPQRSDQAGGQVYPMGLSCGSQVERYIVVPEAEVPPILLQLFKRVVTKQP